MSDEDMREARDEIVRHLEPFAAAWARDATSPAVARFALTIPPPLRPRALAEFVKLDVEYRLERGLDRALEEYLAEFPELNPVSPSIDLLYEDFRLRRNAGRSPDPGDYYNRFPVRAAELARVIAHLAPGADASTDQSSSLFGTRPPKGLAPGQRVDEFDLIRELPGGALAKVFLATQWTYPRPVALKVSADRGTEAATLAQLDHPHIVRVYDQRVVTLPDPVTGRDRRLRLVYMVFLKGGNLRAVVDRAGAVGAADRSGRTLLAAVDAALDDAGERAPASATRAKWAGRTWPEVVCATGAKLAAALDHAHRRGVLHRDVKPANILLTEEGEPLLADFNVGYSKLNGIDPGTNFGGSFPYMALEHLEAYDPSHLRDPSTVDGRADVFGLAVTLWELATGDKPFRPKLASHNDLRAFADSRRAGPDPTAVAAFPAGVPGLRDVLLRCLDPNPDHRPTAGELARELELCQRPATWDLVRITPGGWRGFVRRHPQLVILSSAVLVNLLMSAFNVYYNKEALVSKWPDEKRAKRAYNWIVPGINTFFFTLGILLVAKRVRPVGRGLRQVAAGEPPDPGELAGLRWVALSLGRITAGVCAGCWVTAGVVWPVSMSAAAGRPPNEMEVYLHFWASLSICGLMAAIYPYFLVTFVAVRGLYPGLLGPDGPAESDRPALARVERELGWFEFGAAAAAFLAVGGMLLAAGSGVSKGVVVAGVIMCLVGLAGAGLASLVASRTRADLTALADVPVSEGR